MIDWYAYDRAEGWRPLDPLFLCDADTLEETLMDRGFEHNGRPTLGIGAAGFLVQVHPRLGEATPRDASGNAFIVSVSIGARLTLITLKALPDLLSLLQELGPVTAWTREDFNYQTGEAGWVK
jgi:hypothetical protein